MCIQIKILGQQKKMEVLLTFSSQLFKDLFFINCWIFAKSFLESSVTAQNHHEVAEQSPWSATILKTYKYICPWRMILQMGIFHNKSCTYRQIHEVVERGIHSHDNPAAHAQQLAWSYREKILHDNPVDMHSHKYKTSLQHSLIKKGTAFHLVLQSDIPKTARQTLANSSIVWRKLISCVRESVSRRHTDTE